MVRAVTDPDNIEAEFAIIVRSDLKGRGLGRMLLDKLVRYQRSRGTQRLVGEVLHENEAMRQLARDIGFRIDAEASDGGSLRHVLELQGAAGDPRSDCTELAGRSARLVVTMGMPALVYRWYFRAHSLKALERNILGFVGIAPVRETLVGSVEGLDEAERKEWLAKLAALGRKAA